MLKPKYAKILAIVSGLTLAATAGAQVLIGGFQGSGDPTDAGWTDLVDGQPITSDPKSSFVTGGVPGFSQSLQISGPGTNFGNPAQLQIQLTPAQIQAFNTNSWLTVTFSVPTGASTGGYCQLYNVAFNAPGYGYNNWMSGGNQAATWGTYSQSTGNTNNNQNGMPNFYFFSGQPSLDTETITINYAPITNAIIAGGESYLQITFQAQLIATPVGSATNLLFNSVVLSKTPFGAAAVGVPTNVFLVDNFSSNGVSPSNPANDDFFPTNEVYANGQITNVWVNYFGTTFAGVTWAPGVSPSYAPSQGSMAIQLNWTSGSQLAMWENGSIYGPNISALTYTNFQCDVMFAQGSVTDLDGTFGNLQFGTPASGNSGNSGGQDYFGGANNGIEISATNAGVWQHVSIPLNPNDAAELSISSVIFHIYQGYTGGNLNGSATLYVDNIEFVAPQTVTKIPPPVMSVQPATPGLRMFVGSSATYIREGVITTQGSGENESWVGSGVHYPVNYSFQLLSYPPANIGVTELAILPEASFNTTANFQTTIYNNSFLDFQDSNGLYVVIAPSGGNGAVTAAVQWKVGLPSPSVATTNVLNITNSTAIGTWTLTMNSATSGSLTPPGSPQGFTIADPNVASDFANPAVAAFFEDPNAAAGYGLYEDIGTISITGVASGNQTENFANETNDFNSGTSPGGFFQNNYSVYLANLVISRKGLDKYWVNWTQDLQNNYQVITATNLLVPVGQWISPTYYSDYNIPDETAPRGVGAQHGSTYWELLPADDLPTVDGGFQPGAPTISDPLAPRAFFMVTTNTANIFPPTP